MAGNRPSVWARDLTRGQLIGADVLIAACYVLVRLWLSSGVLEAEGHPAGWTQLVLTVFIAAPIAVRRLWPLPAFEIVLIASVLSVLFGGTADFFAAAAFCLYPVALSDRLPGSGPGSRRSPVRVGIVAAAGVLVVVFLPLIAKAEPGRLSSPSGQFAVGLLLLGAAWLIGQATSERRQYAARTARPAGSSSARVPGR